MKDEMPEWGGENSEVAKLEFVSFIKFFSLSRFVIFYLANSDFLSGKAVCLVSMRIV